MSTPASQRFNTGNWPCCSCRGCTSYGTIAVATSPTSYIFRCLKHLSAKRRAHVLEARAAFNPIDRNKEHFHA